MEKQKEAKGAQSPKDVVQSVHSADHDLQNQYSSKEVKDKSCSKIFERPTEVAEAEPSLLLSHVFPPLVKMGAAKVKKTVSIVSEESDFQLAVNTSFRKSLPEASTSRGLTSPNAFNALQAETEDSELESEHDEIGQQEGFGRDIILNKPPPVKSTSPPSSSSASAKHKRKKRKRSAQNSPVSGGGFPLLLEGRHHN